MIWVLIVLGLLIVYLVYNRWQMASVVQQIARVLEAHRDHIEELERRDK